MTGDSLDRLEVALGRLLHAGTFASAVMLGAGLLLSVFVGPSRFAGGLLTGGLFVLMGTPVMRVVVSLVAYIRMREWLFVAATSAVFVLLALTVVLAWAKAAAG